MQWQLSLIIVIIVPLKGPGVSSCSTLAEGHIKWLESRGEEWREKAIKGRGFESRPLKSSLECKTLSGWLCGCFCACVFTDTPAFLQDPNCQAGPLFPFWHSMHSLIYTWITTTVQTEEIINYSNSVQHLKKSALSCSMEPLQFPLKRFSLSPIFITLIQFVKPTQKVIK